MRPGHHYASSLPRSCMDPNQCDNFSGIRCCLFDVTLYLCTCPRYTRALLRSPIQTSTDALAEVLMVNQAIDGSAVVDASMAYISNLFVLIDVIVMFV